MTAEIYLAYVLACILIAIIPGPTVTVIVANSRRTARVQDCSMSLARSSASA